MKHLISTLIVLALFLAACNPPAEPGGSDVTEVTIEESRRWIKR